MHKRFAAMGPVIAMMIGLAVLFGLDQFGFWVGLNHALFDQTVRFIGARPPAEKIAIVAIDEATLDKFGRWPIARSHYIDLLVALKQARVVGFDIILHEPTTDDPALGHVHLEQDTDGVVRKVFNTLTYGGITLPSFAAAVLRQSQASNSTRPHPPVLRQPNRSSNMHIYQRQPMAINYYGPAQTFPYYSMADVLAGKWPPAFFKDKIVLVGPTCPGTAAGILTPFSQDRNRMPAVEAQAQILGNLRDKTYFKTWPQPYQWVMVVLGAFFTLYLFIRLPAGRAVFLWMGMLLAVTLGGFLVLKIFRRWYPPAFFYATAVVAFILAYIYRIKALTQVLQQAEKDWEDTFNTIDEAIAVHDQNCRLVRANGTARETFGKPLLELLDQKCRYLVEGNENKGLEETPDGKGWFDTVYLEACRRHVEIKTLPRRGHRGRLQGLVHIGRDITEKIAVEKRQQDLQQQLIRAQKMEALGTLAGGIAHDFNNILSAIIGYSELAALDIDPEDKVQEQLKQVIAAGGRAKELVRQILTFSRQADREKKPVSIGIIIKETLKLMRPALPTTIEIQTDLQSNGTVIGDPTQLHQIVMNLCTNAYHAMRASGGVLRVTVDDIEIAPNDRGLNLSPGFYVRIKIADSGHGIPADIISAIFDPYFTTKNKEEGTGLGLSVVHGIVQVHGGTISVESQPGKGSVFTVLLPRAADEKRSIRQLPQKACPKGMNVF